MVHSPPYAPLLGILLCFAGYPLFRISVLAFGLVVGGGSGYFLSHYLAGSGTAAVVGAAVGAVLGALLLWLFLRAGLFFLGVCLGGGAALTLDLERGLILAAALVGGLFALLMSRWILIFLTSAAGALLISQATLGRVPWAAENPVQTAQAVAVLSWIAGAAVQVWLTRKR
ncbi:MAG: hypothetical protein AB1640_20685 [bacterium]